MNAFIDCCLIFNDLLNINLESQIASQPKLPLPLLSQIKQEEVSQLIFYCNKLNESDEDDDSSSSLIPVLLSDKGNSRRLRKTEITLFDCSSGKRTAITNNKSLGLSKLASFTSSSAERGFLDEPLVISKASCYYTQSKLLDVYYGLELVTPVQPRSINAVDLDLILRDTFDISTKKQEVVLLFDIKSVVVDDDLPNKRRRIESTTTTKLLKSLLDFTKLSNKQASTLSSIKSLESESDTNTTVQIFGTSTPVAIRRAKGADGRNGNEGSFIDYNYNSVNSINSVLFKLFDDTRNNKEGRDTGDSDGDSSNNLAFGFVNKNPLNDTVIDDYKEYINMYANITRLRLNKAYEFIYHFIGDLHDYIVKYMNNKVNHRFNVNKNLKLTIFNSDVFKPLVSTIKLLISNDTFKNVHALIEDFSREFFSMVDIVITNDEDGSGGGDSKDVIPVVKYHLYHKYEYSYDKLINGNNTGIKESTNVYLNGNNNNKNLQPDGVSELSFIFRNKDNDAFRLFSKYWEVPMALISMAYSAITNFMDTKELFKTFVFNNNTGATGVKYESMFSDNIFAANDSNGDGVDDEEDEDDTINPNSPLTAEQSVKSYIKDIKKQKEEIKLLLPLPNVSGHSPSYPSSNINIGDVSGSLACRDLKQQLQSAQSNLIMYKKIFSIMRSETEQAYQPYLDKTASKLSSMKSQLLEVEQRLVKQTKRALELEKSKAEFETMLLDETGNKISDIERQGEMIRSELLDEINALKSNSLLLSNDLRASINEREIMEKEYNKLKLMVEENASKIASATASQPLPSQTVIKPKGRRIIIEEDENEEEEEEGEGVENEDKEGEEKEEDSEAVLNESHSQDIVDKALLASLRLEDFSDAGEEKEEEEEEGDKEYIGIDFKPSDWNTPYEGGDTDAPTNKEVIEIEEDEGEEEEEKKDENISEEIVEGNDGSDEEHFDLELVGKDIDFSDLRSPVYYDKTELFKIANVPIMRQDYYGAIKSLNLSQRVFNSWLKGAAVAYNKTMTFTPIQFEMLPLEMINSLTKLASNVPSGWNTVNNFISIFSEGGEEGEESILPTITSANPWNTYNTIRVLFKYFKSLIVSAERNENRIDIFNIPMQIKSSGTRSSDVISTLSFDIYETVFFMTGGVSVILEGGEEENVASATAATTDDYSIFSINREILLEVSNRPPRGTPTWAEFIKKILDTFMTIYMMDKVAFMDIDHENINLVSRLKLIISGNSDKKKSKSKSSKAATTTTTGIKKYFKNESYVLKLEKMLSDFYLLPPLFSAIADSGELDNRLKALISEAQLPYIIIQILTTTILNIDDTQMNTRPLRQVFSIVNNEKTNEMVPTIVKYRDNGLRTIRKYLLSARDKSYTNSERLDSVVVRNELGSNLPTFIKSNYEAEHFIFTKSDSEVEITEALIKSGERKRKVNTGDVPELFTDKFIQSYLSHMAYTNNRVPYSLLYDFKKKELGIKRFGNSSKVSEDDKMVLDGGDDDNNDDAVDSGGDNAEDGNSYLNETTIPIVILNPITVPTKKQIVLDDYTDFNTSKLIPSMRSMINPNRVNYCVLPFKIKLVGSTSNEEEDGEEEEEEESNKWWWGMIIFWMNQRAEKRSPESTENFNKPRVILMNPLDADYLSILNNTDPTIVDTITTTAEAATAGTTTEITLNPLSEKKGDSDSMDLDLSFDLGDLDKDGNDNNIIGGSSSSVDGDDNLMEIVDISDDDEIDKSGIKEKKKKKNVNSSTVANAVHNINGIMQIYLGLIYNNKDITPETHLYVHNIRNVISEGQSSMIYNLVQLRMLFNIPLDKIGLNDKINKSFGTLPLTFTGGDLVGLSFIPTVDIPTITQALDLETKLIMYYLTRTPKTKTSLKQKQQIATGSSSSSNRRQSFIELEREFYQLFIKAKNITYNASLKSLIKTAGDKKLGIDGSTGKLGEDVSGSKEKRIIRPPEDRFLKKPFTINQFGYSIDEKEFYNAFYQQDPNKSEFVTGVFGIYLEGVLERLHTKNLPVKQPLKTFIFPLNLVSNFITKETSEPGSKSSSKYLVNMPELIDSITTTTTPEGSIGPALNKNVISSSNVLLFPMSYSVKLKSVTAPTQYYTTYFMFALYNPQSFINGGDKSRLVVIDFTYNKTIIKDVVSGDNRLKRKQFPWKSLKSVKNFKASTHKKMVLLVDVLNKITGETTISNDDTTNDKFLYDTASEEELFKVKRKLLVVSNIYPIDYELKTLDVMSATKLVEPKGKEEGEKEEEAQQQQQQLKPPNIKKEIIKKYSVDNSKYNLLLFTQRLMEEVNVVTVDNNEKKKDEDAILNGIVGEGSSLLEKVGTITTPLVDKERVLEYFISLMKQNVS